MQRRHIALTVAVWALAQAPGWAADTIDFATKIQPIFAARCIKCHGPDRQQAKLRLDSAEAIGAFAKDTLLVAGKPDESELLKRISLPAGDRKRMPKGGDPLAAEEIALIREWIAEGAKLAAVTTPATDAADAAEESAEPAPRGEDDPELQALEPASAEAIAKIEAAGGAVMPLFADSPLLQVSFAQAESPARDEAIASLEAAADQIVWLNLSKAQVSADGLAPLAKLKNLIQLHLEHSSVDDAGLAHLADLKRLEYLNLYGTSTTDAGLKSLEKLSTLRNLYLWQTKASYDAAMALEEKISGLDANLGWDHPQVMKVRLAKELETAKEIAKTADDRAKELEQQFNAAREAKDQAAARLKELEEQIKALDAPPAEEGDGADEEEEQEEEERNDAPKDEST